MRRNCFRLENAYAIKNEIANMCNSTVYWAQEAQKNVDKITGAIQLGKQYVEELNETSEEEQVSWFLSD